MEKTAKENLVARFEAELATVDRPGVDKLLAYIRKSDFYTAPASTKHHLATEGGLLQHSLNVLDALRGILTRKPDSPFFWEYRVAGKTVDTIPDPSVTMAALLHDICKTHFYGVSYRNVKNEKTKRWGKAPYYTVNDRMPLGHGPKSAMIIKEYASLTTQELYAIWHHMGMPEDYEGRMSYNSAVEAYPFILALHTADMMASHYMEGDAENKPEFTPGDLNDETGEATMDEHMEADANAANGSGTLDFQETPSAEQPEATESGQNAAVSNEKERAGENTAPEGKSDCAAPVGQDGGQSGNGGSHAEQEAENTENQ